MYLFPTQGLDHRQSHNCHEAQPHKDRGDGLAQFSLCRPDSLQPQNNVSLVGALLDPAEEVAFMVTVKGECSSSMLSLAGPPSVEAACAATQAVGKTYAPNQEEHCCSDRLCLPVASRLLRLLLC